MEHIRENVAVALLVAALVIVAFWGVTLHLLALLVVVVVVAYLPWAPAVWEHFHHS